MALGNRPHRDHRDAQGWNNGQVWLGTLLHHQVRGQLIGDSFRVQGDVQGWFGQRHDFGCPKPMMEAVNVPVGRGESSKKHPGSWIHGRMVLPG